VITSSADVNNATNASLELFLTMFSLSIYVKNLAI